MNLINQEFENKNILIWGFGLEGKSSYDYLLKHHINCQITITDNRELDVDRFVSIDKIDFNSFDLILKAPGIVVDKDIDDKKISGQSALFLKYYGKQVIGITGTKGKSTTSSLLYQVLGKKYDTFLVGNIGKACFDIIDELKEDSLVVFEISCHQLEFSKYSPYIGVYLNLYEEHLDHYGTLEKYGLAKANIFKYQKSSDIAIYNEFLNYPIPALNQYKASEGDNGNIYHINNLLYFNNDYVEVDENKCAIIGSHNYYNMAIVYAISSLLSISKETFVQALYEFSPLNHRLQYIGEHQNIKYVDDSISTIPYATIKAISALNNVNSVLIGGLDRNIDYQVLIDYINEHTNINYVLMYATGKRIYDHVNQTNNIYLVNDLKEAVTLAKKVTKPHHICLLSPASASYDHFKNFEERGDIFKELAFKED
ncbi:MAG: UDP-N-acetylmuramoyl-L-alanine--D-glutamate ligase [Erysipelotrichaceae bacterium]